jgi:hypothetical protein
VRAYNIGGIAASVAFFALVGSMASYAFTHQNQNTIAPGATFDERQAWRDNRLREMGAEIQRIYEDFIMDYARTHGVPPDVQRELPKLPPMEGEDAPL